MTLSDKTAEQGGLVTPDEPARPKDSKSVTLISPLDLKYPSALGTTQNQIYVDREHIRLIARKLNEVVEYINQQYRFNLEQRAEFNRLRQELANDLVAMNGEVK